jgi:hypothetical protein
LVIQIILLAFTIGDSNLVNFVISPTNVNLPSNEPSKQSDDEIKIVEGIG